IAPKIFWSSLILTIIALVALVGPWVAPDPTLIDPNAPTLGPFSITSPQVIHWFGTDDLGRDLFSRIAVGAQISLLIGIATAIVSVLIGTLYGTVSAYFEGRTDAVMMRVIDVIYSLPGLMIVILFSVFLGRNIPSLVLALALFSWPDTARI